MLTVYRMSVIQRTPHVESREPPCLASTHLRFSEFALMRFSFFFCFHCCNSGIWKQTSNLYFTTTIIYVLILTVPSSIVLQILTERLSRIDCTARGWVLHGFPQDVDQAEKLQESNFIPNRCFLVALWIHMFLFNLSGYYFRFVSPRLSLIVSVTIRLRLPTQITLNSVVQKDLISLRLHNLSSVCVRVSHQWAHIEVRPSVKEPCPNSVSFDTETREPAQIRATFWIWMSKSRTLPLSSAWSPEFPRATFQLIWITILFHMLSGITIWLLMSTSSRGVSFSLRLCTAMPYFLH